jgi:hypothetical protein
MGKQRADSYCIGIGIGVGIGAGTQQLDIPCVSACTASGFTLHRTNGDTSSNANESDSDFNRCTRPSA